MSTEITFQKRSTKSKERRNTCMLIFKYVNLYFRKDKKEKRNQCSIKPFTTRYN